MKRLLTTLFRLIRPAQVLLLTFVYVFGVIIALAQGHALEWTDLLWGYAAMLPITASIHLANEYADYETDLITERTPYSGGSGALKDSSLPRALALNTAWGALLLGGSIVIGGFLSHNLNLTALIILAVAAFFGWMYSLPPLALAWRGWGELDNAALGGVLMPVYGYAVLSGLVDLRAVLAVLPFGLLVFTNLLATTWPDRTADAQVGKFTLATRWSPRRLQVIFWIAGLSAFIQIYLLLGWVMPPVVVWMSFIAFPFIVWGGLTYTRKRSPFPTVAAMVVLLGVQMIGWLLVII